MSEQPKAPAEPASGDPRGEVMNVREPDPGRLWTEATVEFSRWIDGDPAGLDELVRLMTPVLWHVVRSYRLPYDAAEDVVQTTWLALVRRCEAIQDASAIGSWLTTTARREAWRWTRASARLRPVEDEVIAPRLPRQPAVDQDVVELDECERLWAAVRTLDDRCQRLLRIVAFEHRPDYAVVARQLEMPVGSIGPTRGRCLAKLKAALDCSAFSDGAFPEGVSR
ncbi:MAG: RNA polymerase sigma factor [Nocardioides sp.]